MPTLKTAKAMKSMEPGQILEVLGTDPGTQKDIPKLVKKSGTEWLGYLDKDNYQHFGKFLKLPNPNIIWVMVQIKSHDISTARYFVCSEKQIQAKTVKQYKKFMEKHNYWRPGGGASTQAVLNLNELLEHEDNWKILPDYKKYLS